MIFSEAHNSAIFIICAACIVLYAGRKKIMEGRLREFIRIGLAVLLLAQEASFHLWNIAIGEWSVDFALPLQLCAVSAILSAVMLLTKSYRLFEIVYFWGVGGAMQAVLTPEIGIYTFSHFRYFQFFIGHGAIILASLFMVFVEGCKPSHKSLWRSMFALNAYAAVVGILNKVFNANYMFLCSKPETSSIMDFLGPWPWYIASLEAAAVIIFYILYVPFIIRWKPRRANIKGNFIGV